MNGMNVRRLGCLVAGLVLGAALLLGQGNDRGGDSTSGGQTGGNTGGQRGGGTQTQSQDPFGNQGGQNDPFGTMQGQMNRQQRPLYLNGSVLMDDGQPPMEPVVIQRVCTGNTYPEGYTDSKGRFSFQVGGDMSMLTSDASVAGGRINAGGMMAGGTYTNDGIREIGIGRFDLSACVLRAELSGYRSDQVQLMIYSVMDNNDVGTIVLHRLDGVVGNVVSALTLQAPKNAQKAYYNGLREMRKKKPNYKKGAAQFQKAVSAYPQFAAAWAAMGDARMAMDDDSGAREAFSKSVQADPEYMKPYEPLIRMAVNQADWESTGMLCRAYLKLNPNSGNARFLAAVASLNTGKSDEAEEMVRTMQESGAAAQFPQSFQIMAMVHEQRAEFEAAAEQYREFLAVTREPQGPAAKSASRKLKEWQMLGVIEKPAAE